MVGWGVKARGRTKAFLDSGVKGHLNLLSKITGVSAGLTNVFPSAENVHQGEY